MELAGIPGSVQLTTEETKQIKQHHINSASVATNAIKRLVKVALMHFEIVELLTIVFYCVFITFITGYKAIMTVMNTISKLHYFSPTEK